MKKQDLRILIVEDDPTLGRALQGVVQKAGFQTDLFARPDEALAAAKRGTYNAVIVDCMLPRMHGVDLVQALRSEGSGMQGAILMSGVFKDKAFVKDALQKTQAQHFLQKPFDANELVTLLEQQLDGLIEEDKEPIFELLVRPSASTRDVRKAIESMEIVEGSNLPYIFCLLLDTGISGHLNIISESSGVSGVTFGSGKILNVDTPDKMTFLGVLLVEKGYLSAANHQSIINAPPNERRIGQRLVESNFLSPHALPIVLSEQMVLRLGKTIESTPARINFVPADVPDSKPAMDNSAFTPFLHDWFFSKIKIDWIRSFYLSWLDHKLLNGPYVAKFDQLSKLPVFEKLPGFLDFLRSGETLSQLLMQQKYPEDLFYRGLHLLVIRRVVSFDDKKQTADKQDHGVRLKKLAVNLEGKNYFEVFETLGVNRKAPLSEIQKVYRDFSKLYHPDRAAQNLPQELALLAQEVYSKITRAYKILTDEPAKEKYLRELEQNETKKHFEAESQLDEGKSQLAKNNFVKALELFDLACRIVEPTTHMRLYRTWARIKIAETSPMNQQAHSQMDEDLTAIPPEDRHNATYFMVKGLYEKMNGNLDLALRNFEHAAALDPKMVEAKRESNILKMKINQKPQSVLNADLKDVFGLLFKKKAR